MPLWLRAFGIRIYSLAVFGIDQEIEKLKDTDKTSEEDREMVEEQSAKYGTGPAGLSRSIPRMLRTAARSQQVCSSVQYLSSTEGPFGADLWMSRILCRVSVEITARSTDRLDPFPSVPLVASKCADEPTTVAGSAFASGAALPVDECGLHGVHMQVVQAWVRPGEGGIGEHPCDRRQQDAPIDRVGSHSGANEI